MLWTQKNIHKQHMEGKINKDDDNNDDDDDDEDDD